MVRARLSTGGQLAEREDHRLGGVELRERTPGGPVREAGQVGFVLAPHTHGAHPGPPGHVGHHGGVTAAPDQVERHDRAA
jgi:hypothetical protein